MATRTGVLGIYFRWQGIDPDDEEVRAERDNGSDSLTGQQRHTVSLCHWPAGGEVLGHTRVTTTERYTHVATLQMKDASERMDQALWGPG